MTTTGIGMLPTSNGGGRPVIPVTEEFNCLRCVVESLELALLPLLKPAAALRISQPITPEEAVELIRLAGSLLVSNPEQTRSLVFEAPFCILTTLTHVVGAPLRLPLPSVYHAEERESSVGPVEAAAGPSRVSNLKVTALDAIKSIVMLCSEDVRLSSLLRNVVGDCRACSTIVALVTNASSSQALRLAAGGALFCIASVIGRAILRGTEVRLLCEAINVEPHSTVRGYLSAIVRQIAASTLVTPSVSAISGAGKVGLSSSLPVGQKNAVAESNEGRRQTDAPDAANGDGLPNAQDANASNEVLLVFEDVSEFYEGVRATLLDSDVQRSVVRWLSDANGDVRCLGLSTLDIILRYTTVTRSELVRYDPGADGLLSVIADALVLRMGLTSLASTSLDPRHEEGEDRPVGGRMFHSFSSAARLSAAAAPTTTTDADKAAVFGDGEEVEATCRLAESVCQLASTIHSDVVFAQLHRADLGSFMVHGVNRELIVAAAAARTLRVFVERAPYYLGVAERLTDGYSLRSLCRCTLSYDCLRPDASVPEKMLCVEVALVIALIACHASSNRRRLRLELRSFPVSPDALRRKLQGDLVSVASIDYFNDLLIVDEHGVVMNEAQGSHLVWVNETEIAPESIRALLEMQELRQPHPPSSEQWRRVDEHRTLPTYAASASRRAYLAFALLGYAIHNVFASQTEYGALEAAGAASPLRTRRGASPNRESQQNNSVHRPRQSFSAPKPTPLESRLYDASVEATVYPLQDGDDQEQQRAASSSPSFSRRMHPSAPVPLRGSATGMTTTTGSVADDSWRQSASRARKLVASPGKVSGRAIHPPLRVVASALRSEFAAAMSLVVRFANHYAGPRSAASISMPTPEALDAGVRSATASLLVPDPEAPGYFIRATAVAKQQQWKATASRTGSLHNPWSAPKPADRSDPLQWTLPAVQEGDLFFFSVPLSAMSAMVMDAVAANAKRHLYHLKRVLAVTPQATRNRRHFLSDMVQHVMPNVIVLIARLAKFISSFSEGSTKMALNVFPGIRNYGSGGAGPGASAAAAADVANEDSVAKGVDCHNVVQVVDYLEQRFSKSVSTAAAGGGGGHNAVVAAQQQHVRAGGPPSNGQRTSSGGAVPLVAGAALSRRQLRSLGGGDKPVGSAEGSPHDEADDVRYHSDDDEGAATTTQGDTGGAAYSSGNYQPQRPFPSLPTSRHGGLGPRFHATEPTVSSSDSEDY